MKCSDSYGIYGNIVLAILRYWKISPQFQLSWHFNITINNNIAQLYDWQQSVLHVLCGFRVGGSNVSGEINYPLLHSVFECKYIRNFCSRRPKNFNKIENKLSRGSKCFDIFGRGRTKNRGSTFCMTVATSTPCLKYWKSLAGEVFISELCICVVSQFN